MFRIERSKEAVWEGVQNVFEEYDIVLEYSGDRGMVTQHNFGGMVLQVPVNLSIDVATVPEADGDVTYLTLSAFYANSDGALNVGSSAPDSYDELVQALFEEFDDDIERLSSTEQFHDPGDGAEVNHPYSN